MSAIPAIYDVAVIGGGLAGAAAATCLAAGGAQVLVLEKEHQAHHKVCGEFISCEAQRDLEALGIDLVALGGVPVSRFRLTAGRRSFEMPLPFGAMSLSRYRLDAALLDKAAASGAEIKRGVTVTGTAWQDGVWRVDAGQQTFAARTVFLASGKHDLRGQPRRVGRQNDYVGFKMHFQLPPAPAVEERCAVEIFLFRGGYAGWEAIEAGKANVCLVVEKSRLSRCGKSWPNLLRAIAEQTPLLATRLQDAVPCWDKPLAIYNIPYGFTYQPNPHQDSALFRLGDQMAVIPSICGDGMAIALYTGLAAARYYGAQAGADAYHRRMYRQLSPQIAYASRMARLLSLPLMQSLAVPFCRLFPRRISGIIRRTRIAEDDMP